MHIQHFFPNGSVSIQPSRGRDRRGNASQYATMQVMQHFMRHMHMCHFREIRLEYANAHFLSDIATHKALCHL